MRDAVKRGELFPGQSEKDRRQREDKEESDDELGEKICVVCSKMKIFKTTKTHSTQECRQLAKFNGKAGSTVEPEKEDRPCREVHRRVSKEEWLNRVTR